MVSLVRRLGLLAAAAVVGVAAAATAALVGFRSFEAVSGRSLPLIVVGVPVSFLCGK